MTIFSNRRRSIIKGIVGTSAVIGLPPSISFGAEKPLTIVVGYPPGGSSDVFARLMARSLQEVLQRNVVVRNQPGASGQIAANAVLREGQDGSSILAINQPDLSLIVARGVGKFKLSDFSISMVDVREPRVFLVKSGGAIASFSDFVEQAKKAPGKLSISVTGGSAQEYMARWLVKMLKIDVIIANYKGGNESVQSLLAGNVTANIGDDFVRASLSGSLKCLFLGSDVKSPRWPQAPSMSSVLTPYGIDTPSPSFLSRYGIYATSSEWALKDPAGYKSLQKALLDARQTSAFQDYLVKNQIEDLSVGKPGEGFGRIFESEMEQLQRHVTLN